MQRISLIFIDLPEDIDLKTETTELVPIGKYIFLTPLTGETYLLGCAKIDFFLE
jgi:hypothetical protein